MSGIPGGAAVTALGLLLAALVAGTGRRRPARFRFAEALMIAGTAPWIFLVLRPGHQPETVYLVPLADLRDQLRFGLGFAAWQICGNLLVFAAFGFGAPIRWRIRPGTVLVVAALASAGLEFTQYLMADGRVASLDDVLVNALGAGIAALCSRPWWRERSRPGREERPEGRSWRGRRPKPGSTLSSGAGSLSQR